MSDDHDWKATLADLRQAYRIVVAYHDRTHHLLREIENLFPELQFAEWQPTYTHRPPSRLKRPMEKWTWDGVPFHNMLVCFTLRGSGTTGPFAKGNWFLVAHLESDDTVFDAERDQRHKGGSPNPAKLPDAREATSTLTLSAFIVQNELTNTSTSRIWYDSEDGDEGVWSSDLDGKVEFLYRWRPLEEVFPDRKIQEFASELRADLRKKGIELSDDVTQED
ncbi:hypothetical protein SAMN05428995_105232 [Loktanella sp. DSM 29012]|uniref:hypothetical protein n=1 Tax=Loktanella sp. DSM 29012 TaxID=1881056 RepID=UPI0008CD92F6|nr:hypothetical protein [Loktanella sp. DSM 29012]SEQ59366.1 hypothetical protein SAMN05428995_105232 [Loktanella sp. DSM 29012]